MFVIDSDASSAVQAGLPEEPVGRGRGRLFGPGAGGAVHLSYQSHGLVPERRTGDLLADHQLLPREEHDHHLTSSILYSTHSPNNSGYLFRPKYGYIGCTYIYIYITCSCE